MRLCLNMIVKNEAAVIRRCLESVAPHIDAWVICDTGSTDGTQKIIRDFFAERRISGELLDITWRNFSQARNEALSRSRASTLQFDGILLIDADMELIVSDPLWRQKLTRPAYHVPQRSDTLTYWNTRIVHRDLDCRYIGATHEYLQTPHPPNNVDGDKVLMLDHADGANRPEKTARDIALLLGELEQDPHNVRAMFYLAETYWYSRVYVAARQYYQLRAAAGGWDEEVWFSTMRIAQCHRELGAIPDFITTALAAHQMRPHRAEPLHLLARHFRDAGQHESAMLFAEAGEKIPYPRSDKLFVDDAVYRDAFRDIVGVSGFYSQREQTRERAAEVAIAMTTSPSATHHARMAARHNARFFARQIQADVHRIGIPVEQGWSPLNPSIHAHRGRVYAVVRTVNYTIRGDGRYDTLDPGGVIRTRNMFCRIDDDMRATSVAEMLDKTDARINNFPVRGFEDCRLFYWRKSWWCTATVRDRTPGGLCRIALLELNDERCVTSARILPALRDHEKNWMPVVVDDKLILVHSLDPATIYELESPSSDPTLVRHDPGQSYRIDHLRGGSQLVPFEDGWLCVTHEAVDRVSQTRVYLHRFVWLDRQFIPRRVSKPFWWKHVGIEFCAGLHFDKSNRVLLASVGVSDREAWIAKIPLDSIEALWPSGA